MELRVRRTDGGHELTGAWAGVAEANAFLRHLAGRGFSPATVRAYAFDLLNFARFLGGRDRSVADVGPMDIFEWIDAQGVRRPGRAGSVVALRRPGAAPSSVNRRVAAVRAFFSTRS